MAFDNADTDKWYETALIPTMKRLGVTVRRVDRIEHNDDIDDRIIAEIEAADFIVADLTYARPSVYFEAGYAQRKVPVIYTARTDHFSPNPARPDLRVHFDLAMKNIIGWKTPEDPAFGARLQKRVALVTAPIVKAAAQDGLAKEDREAFARLSLLGRFDVAADAMTKIVSESRLVKLDQPGSGRAGQLRRVLTGSSFHAGVISGLQAVIEESVTLATLRRHLQVQMSFPSYNIQLPRAADRLEHISDIFIIGTISSVPMNRITSALRFFDVVDSRAKHFRWSGDENWPGRRLGSFRRVQPVEGYSDRFKATRSNGDQVVLLSVDELGIVTDAKVSVPLIKAPRTLDVVVIDQISSPRDVADRLTSALERWRAGAPQGRSLLEVAT